MRRALLIALSLLFASAAAPAAGPAEPGLAALAADLQAALGLIAGAGDGPAEVREVGDGLYSLSVPLDSATASTWRQTAPKTFQILTLGHQGYPPSSPRALATSALMYPFERPNFWFAVVNLGAEDRIAPTIHTVRCPDLKVDRIGDLNYPKATVTLYWHGGTEQAGRAGQCTEKVRVAGAGARSARFFVRQ
jgi:hypothetical protein